MLGAGATRTGKQVATSALGTCKREAVLAHQKMPRCRAAVACLVKSILGRESSSGLTGGQRPVGELLTMVPPLDHSDEYGAEVLAWAPLVRSLTRFPCECAWLFLWHQFKHLWVRWPPEKAGAAARALLPHSGQVCEGRGSSLCFST